MKMRVSIFALAMAEVTVTEPARAQERGEHASDAALAKKSQDPISDLGVLPLEQQTNFGVGPHALRSEHVVRFHPVVPFDIDDRWRIVTRTNVPLVDQPLPGGERIYGVGDAELSLVATSAREARVAWGVGPAFVFPSASVQLAMLFPR
jgi:hypothetical protein